MQPDMLHSWAPSTALTIYTGAWHLHIGARQIQMVCLLSHGGGLRDLRWRSSFHCNCKVCSINQVCSPVVYMSRVLLDHSAYAANFAVTPMQGIKGEKCEKEHHFVMVFARPCQTQLIWKSTVSDMVQNHFRTLPVS
jgi:hypothetical protein